MPYQSLIPTDSINTEDDYLPPQNNIKWLTRKLNMLGAIVGHVLVESEMTAISIPMLIMLLHYQILAWTKNDDHPDNSISLALELAIFITVWQVFALANGTLLYYSVAKRTDGKIDKPIAELKGDRVSKRTVICVLVGALPEWTDGFLTGFAVNPVPKSWGGITLSLSLGFIYGSVQWLNFMLSDAQAAWRRYMEGRNIKPLAEQPFSTFLYKRTKYLSIVLRECFPPFIAAQQALAVYQVFARYILQDEPDLREQLILAAALSPLLFCVQQGVANFNMNFDNRQMFDALDDFGIKVDPKPFLLRNKKFLLKSLGKLAYGEVLPALMQKCGGREKAISYVLAIGSAIGSAAACERNVREYLISNKTDEAIILTHFFSTKMSKYFMTIPPMLGTASGFFLSKSKLANVQNVIKELDTDEASPTIPLLKRS